MYLLVHTYQRRLIQAHYLLLPSKEIKEATYLYMWFDMNNVTGVEVNYDERKKAE